MSEFDVVNQVAFWKADAQNSWDDARYLIDDKRVMLGLFAVHLALEKILKAQIIKETGALCISQLKVEQFGCLQMPVTRG